MKMSPFRFLIIVIAVSVCAISWGCSGKKDFSKEQSLLTTWSSALKNMDFPAYAHLEAHPRQPEQFAEMYRDYYPSGIVVLDVSAVSEEKRDAENRLFTSKDVSFGADIIMRKDNSRVPAQGEVKLVRYKDQGSWLIADKTIIRSK